MAEIYLQLKKPVRGCQYAGACPAQGVQAAFLAGEAYGLVQLPAPRVQ